MNENRSRVLLGFALIIMVVIAYGCMPFDPGTEPEKTCEFRTVEFNWGVSEETGEKAIYADPEILVGVQDCAEVVFFNFSEQKITLKFAGADQDPLFSETEEFSLDPYRGGQFSKAFSVDIELPDNDDVYFDFLYSVEPLGAPEQSPRIRVGPRTAGSNSDGQ